MGPRRGMGPLRIDPTDSPPQSTSVSGTASPTSHQNCNCCTNPKPPAQRTTWTPSRSSRPYPSRPDKSWPNSFPRPPVAAAPLSATDTPRRCNPREADGVRWLRDAGDLCSELPAGRPSCGTSTAHRYSLASNYSVHDRFSFHRIASVSPQHVGRPSKGGNTTTWPVVNRTHSRSRSP